MNAFEYASPTSVEQAVRALAGAESSEGLSGGTDLLCRLKDSVSSPSRVVYLKAIADEGFRGVFAEGDGLAIGAGTSLAALLADEAIAAKYPALKQAARSVATPQIRNMATVGGNLLQRPRCWYYRSGFGLLGGRRDGDTARLVRELEGEYAPYNINLVGLPADGHLVRLGDNRYHAIFMTDGDALYVNPSSLAPALIALGATAEIVGPDGSRTVPIADLYRIPSSEGERELTVATDEVLTRVLLPPPKGKNAFYEIRQKQAHDWPLVLASVCLEMDGDTVRQASILLGAVAPVPYRAEAAEAALAGKKLDRSTAEAAGQAATTGAKPLSKNGYKVPLVKTAVKRALLRAAGDEYWTAMEA
ncbi:FAD binding domain-containing protein [Tautonia sociabilis]|uniref:Molybdopterin dehydrogenase n=1 Tax=Tautonia sociabilis TaxID=2080755 RepID=A0A432ML14_9BACT|nr:FAD binding domain-containing protein [Tautonia sociabilis]RUL87825.1 molybdopterin dehydrogenase [Tautonia sociabilis]